MTDVLKINGSTINLAANYVTLDSVTPFVKGGIPELHLSRLVGKLAALPDSWSGKSVTLSMLSSTLVFSGDIQGYVDRYMQGIGWIREYRCLGLINRANYIPVTDSLTDTDTSTWNLPGDDPSFIGSRAGLSVGAIVTDVLNMPGISTPLAAAGIGNYTTTGPPPSGLPSVTATDLAAFTIVPLWTVVISGERVLQAIEQFVQSCYPSTFLHVDPSGNIRFFTTYNFSANTLTLNSDPILPPTLTRDYSDNYSQVMVRGNTLVQGITLQDVPWPGSSSSNGGLIEEFQWGSLSSAAAKAAWVPADWSQPNQYGSAYDTGTCTCPSTLTVTVTSSNSSMTWAANALSQANLQGNLQLFSDTLTGISQIWQVRVISNTALTAGGSSTLTIDTPLPSLTYNAYKLFALNAGPNVVGRKYKVANSAIAAAMQNYFPYPVAYVNSEGNAAAMTSTPVGSVMWEPFGGTGPPYNMGMDTVTLDPVNGYVYFNTPVQVVSNGLNTPVQWPAKVEAFIPVAVGTLVEYAPSSTTYSGTLYTVEGIERTKVITVLGWRDYGNDTNMATFAAEYLSAVKDVVVEGVLPYLDLPPVAFLSPGQGVSIAGNGYTTGWESLNLPVVSVEIQFQSGEQGTSYLCALHLSNRRGRSSFSNYLRPNITGAQFGSENALAGGRINYVGYSGFSPENTGTLAGNASNQLTQAGSPDNQLTQAGGAFNPAGLNAGNQADPIPFVPARLRGRDGAPPPPNPEPEAGNVGADPMGGP